jgi:hypothetical protein
MHRSISAVIFLFLVFTGLPSYAQNKPSDPTPQALAENPIGTRQHPADQGPEEPDFAFIAGGPYTQPKGSLQLIVAGQWGTRRTAQGSAVVTNSQYATLYRNEWGLTDRWELDLIAPGQGERETLNGTPTLSSFALNDTVLGIRYRLFKEDAFPITLTVGPQIILPTGSVSKGTSVGKTGYAWDLSTAKDWGGRVFIYNSLNYSFFPSVGEPQGLSQRHFDLHNLSFGSALGLRALERERRSDSHQDIHCFLEYGATRTESLESGPLGAVKVANVAMVVAPGVRYGVIVQMQVEHVFGRWATPR